VPNNLIRHHKILLLLSFIIIGGQGEGGDAAFAIE
jgi:hypothetical protein